MQQKINNNKTFSKYNFNILSLMLLKIIVLTFFSFQVKASHIMGGSITYECQGSGDYIFQLIFYRDCNGASVNTSSQTLKVWNHPTLNNITVAYVSTEDISPQGTMVSGGASCYNCNTGGNIGIGSIERITYRSLPINISGVPPADGWIFTFDDFSRNTNITNIQNPYNYGITIIAKIFNVENNSNHCNDNSPKFLQTPHFVSCAGKPFKLNLNPVDPDLDSIYISLDQPLNNLNNNPYNEGVNPTAVPFVSGFSTTNPTPNSTMMAGNQDFQINHQTGEMTFLSNMTGNFNVKIKVTSFRKGIRISEVVHEMQLIVTNCTGNNNPPTITPPFSGSFETTVMAGNTINFSLSSSDVELLQDGSPQTNTISPTGLLFGPNPTINAGCLIAPCPTVNVFPAVGTRGANIQFNWQTDCDHLLDVNGNEKDEIDYQFVFRVQDNYCPIPEIVYETVTIKVVNGGVIQAPEITCIQGNGTGDFTINWLPVADPNGTFVSYQVYSVQSGLLATFTNIASSSYTHTGVSSAEDYYIAVISGCNGMAVRHSDTIKSIYLNVSNTNPGIAVLDWSVPKTPTKPTYGDYFYIHREYPLGVWTLIDSVPINRSNYSEVIDICNAFLNYRVTLNNTPCSFVSQINGGNFTDQTPPDIPQIVSVTIDTLTHETTITWTAPPQPDTYGYIVYKQDPQSGFLIELDTIYNKLDTFYTYLEAYQGGSITYTVAAFDSCPSPTGAPFNLSARDPNFHTTIFLQYKQSKCDGLITIDWTNYRGWNAQSYDVFIKENNGFWQLVATTNDLSYNFTGIDLSNYQIVIKANKGDGTFSFSNALNFILVKTPQPSFSYIKFATVRNDDNAVVIEYTFDQSVLVSNIELQKMIKGAFETIETINSPASPSIFTDDNVYVDDESYTYRVIYYDSCGNEGYVSNIGQTILLQSQINNTELKSYIHWSPYQQFNGNVINYNVYRSIDGVYQSTPIATLPSYLRSYEDDLYSISTDGKICYRIEAVEGNNVFNDAQVSYSNESCVIVEPLIFVPNAFIPTGINSEFKPILRNFNQNQYKMTILSRWGQVVFQTDNPSIGWNGKINNNGAEAETATYVYIIEIYNDFGEQIMTRGHVTLLR